MEWQKLSDTEWLGEQDGAAVLSSAHLAIMLGDWNGKGYARFRLSDGRAVWVRQSISGKPGLYPAFIAPWGSLFDCDTVPDDDMALSVKPEGWRTKPLDGIRTYTVLTDAERAERAERKAAADAAKAAQKVEKAAARALAAAERTAATRETRKHAIGAFEAGALAAIEATTGGTTMCLVVALGDDRLPSLVRLSDTGLGLTRNSLSAEFPQGYRWRSLSKWPNGADKVWRSGRTTTKTYWALTCKLGGAESGKR
jgi:hypothetical protein